MFFSITLSILYIITTISTFLSFITMKDKNITVAISVFFGFLFLSFSPIIAIIGEFYSFHSLNIAALIIASKFFGISYLLRTVAGIRAFITENKTLAMIKFFNSLFILYMFFIIAVLFFMFSGSFEFYSYTIYPIVFTNSNWNLYITIIDVLTMILVVLHLPFISEYIFIKIGSSCFAVAAIFLYIYSLTFNPIFLLLSKIFYILNPVINSLSILSLYNKKRLLKNLRGDFKED